MKILKNKRLFLEFIRKKLELFSIPIEEKGNILVILHHLGLGDHIILNGLVNYLSNNYDKIYLFCKKEYLPSVSFLYLINNKISLIPVINQFEAELIYDRLKVPKLKIGFERIEYGIKKFDVQFYEQLNLNFNLRWENFRIYRLINREEFLFNKLNLPSEYIFLHEDISRNFEIKREYIINKNLKIITPHSYYTPIIFDWLKVIENAKEIHCIDSSFKVMIDTIITQKDNMFLHLKLKNNSIRDKFESSNRLQWQIIK